MPQLIKWYEVQLKKLGVKVVLNTAVAAGRPRAQERGRHLRRHPAPGPPCRTSPASTTRRSSTSLMCTRTACPRASASSSAAAASPPATTAIEYGAKGRKISIVEMLPDVGNDVMVVNKISVDPPAEGIRRGAAHQHQGRRHHRRGRRGRARGRQARRPGGRHRLRFRAAAATWSWPTPSRTPIRPRTTIIGDCMKPAKAGSAIREGFYAAMSLK